MLTFLMNRPLKKDQRVAIAGTLQKNPDQPESNEVLMEDMLLLGNS